MSPKNLQLMLMACDAANLCHYAQAHEQIDKMSTALLMSLQVEMLNFITYDSQRYFIDPSREMVIEWANPRERNTGSP